MDSKPKGQSRASLKRKKKAVSDRNHSLLSTSAQKVAVNSADLNDNKIKKTKLKTVQIKVLYAFKINKKGPHKSRSVNNENMTTIKGKRSMEIVIGEQKK